MRLMIGSTGLIIVIIIVVDYCYLLLLLLNYYHFYFYYYFHYFFTINNNYYIKRYIYYSSYYCDLFSNKRYLWRHAPMICCSFLALDWTLVDLVAARRCKIRWASYSWTLGSSGTGKWRHLHAWRTSSRRTECEAEKLKMFRWIWKW